MSFSSREILIELECTLDQLLFNAEALHQKDLLSSLELELIEKTQESLVGKFIHMSELVESKVKMREKKLGAKITKLKEIDPCFAKRISSESRPRIGRNRKKSKSPEFAYCGL